MSSTERLISRYQIGLISSINLLLMICTLLALNTDAWMPDVRPDLQTSKYTKLLSIRLTIICLFVSFVLLFLRSFCCWFINGKLCFSKLCLSCGIFAKPAAN